MRQLLLSLLALALCSCGSITIPNTNACHVAGLLSAGCTCATTVTHVISYKTMDECLDYIEAQPERPDPLNPGKTLAPHGAAVIQSVDDWGKQKTVLEEACRIMGKKCTYEMKQVIAGMALVIQ